MQLMVVVIDNMHDDKEKQEQRRISDDGHSALPRSRRGQRQGRGFYVPCDLSEILSQPTLAIYSTGSEANFVDEWSKSSLD